jgi:hypothetical protein
MKEPRTDLVTVGQIVGSGIGVTRRAVLKAEEVGALTRVQLPGGKIRRFWWAEVKRAFGAK